MKDSLKNHIRLEVLNFTFSRKTKSDTKFARDLKELLYWVYEMGEIRGRINQMDEDFSSSLADQGGQNGIS